MTWEQFSPEDRAFLVALPYRVGLWISRSDRSGGDESAQAEQAALENMVIFFAEDFCKSEFVEALMGQTLARRAEWPSWRDGLETTPTDCRRAIDLIAPVLERKDVSSFKTTLMEIATTVAKAYQEEESAADMMGVGGKIRAMLSQWLGLRAHVNDEFANVSTAERAALLALSAALRPGEAEGLSAASAAVA